MNRRAFITGLLTAPMIVRASSLDALPRGVPLYEPAMMGVTPKSARFFVLEFCLGESTSMPPDAKEGDWIVMTPNAALTSSA